MTVHRLALILILPPSLDASGGGGATAPTAPTPVSPASVAALTAQVPPLAARLVTELQQAGANVYSVEVLRPEASFAWIPVPAIRILVGGDRLHAFEYAAADDVEAALRATSADGTQFAGAQMFWLSDPHIYRRDRMMVLYVGKSPAMMELLTRFVGPQVAGL